jgi:hypothetical protein
MKIINKTSDDLYYMVTPSGTVLSGSKVIASGVVKAGHSDAFPLENAGKSPIVYVKSINQYNQGNFSAQVTDGNSSVEISMQEVSD